MAVQVIRAKEGHKRGNLAANNGQDKLRVCAYARVSTDSDAQETSYESQCRYYTDYIKANPGWEFAGIYADEGITGTTTRKREQFKKMLADCEAGKIDMILTKSISRWARNTVDSLRTIRRLKDLGIGVMFQKENIYTLDAKGEVLITIMSSIAQQESDSISRNVRLGIQYLMQQGKGRLNDRQFLGLAKGEDKYSLLIIPQEADLVRRIYREFLEGFSPGRIAARLTEERIPTPAGKETWYQSTIVSILENEKYCGDLLMQKYYVEDFLSHKIVRNTGQMPQYLVEDHHEPIVPKEVFYQVQGEMQRRSYYKNTPEKIRYGSRNALQGRLICGLCGRVLKRYGNPNPARTDWRCRKRRYDKRSATRENTAACPCRNVPEEEVKREILSAFNKLPDMRDDLIRMQGSVRDGKIKGVDLMIQKNRERLKRLKDRTDQLPDMSDSQEKLFLEDEIRQTQSEWTALLLKGAELACLDLRIRSLLELVDAMKERSQSGIEITDTKPDYDQSGGACYTYEDFFRRTRYQIPREILDDEGRVKTFSDEMVIRYLDKVTVYDDRYQVIFKTGTVV